MKAHFSHAVRTLAQLAAVSGACATFCAPAHAVDGCKLLLCMAGSWQNISQCAPTVREALRGLARGQVWPTCGMGGDSGSANHYVFPQQCPEQYRIEGVNYQGRVTYSCPFTGAITVAVEGQPWSRTWWSMSGDAVIEWLPPARAAFANSPVPMDDRFDRDHAAWVLSEQIRLGAGTTGQGGG